MYFCPDVDLANFMCTLARFYGNKVNGPCVSHRSGEVVCEEANLSQFAAIFARFSPGVSPLFELRLFTEPTSSNLHHLCAPVPHCRCLSASRRLPPLSLILLSLFRSARRRFLSFPCFERKVKHEAICRENRKLATNVKSVCP